MKISKILTFLISLPKTLYFNFLAFPMNTAIKLPVFVSYNVRLIEVKRGVLQFPNGAKPFLVRIGAGGSLGLPTQKSSMRISSGSLIFKGKAKIGGGCFINVKGDMTIGLGFSTNKNCFLSCTNMVTIGDNVLLGWDCHIFDDNGGHHIYHDGEERKTTPKDSAIEIGDHVWICSYSHILAGSRIGGGSVLGYKSLLTKKYTDDNVLLAGCPATIKAHNITWSI